MTATHHSILEVDRRGRLCDSAEQRSALLSLVAAELEVPSPSGTPMEIILPGGAKLAITSSGQIPIATALIAEVLTTASSATFLITGRPKFSPASESS